MRSPCIYILSISAAVSEAFASDSVFNLVWDSRRLRLPAFVLPLSTAFLEGRARRAPTGVPRVSESRATDERGDPELEGYLLGRGETEVLFSSVLEIRFVAVDAKLEGARRHGRLFSTVLEISFAAVARRRA